MYLQYPQYPQYLQYLQRSLQQSNNNSEGEIPTAQESNKYEQPACNMLM